MQGIEFLNEFKTSGISHDSGDKRFQITLDFQDFVGHMNKTEINEFYTDLDQSNRALFIWACSCCLSFDSMVDILKQTTILNERKRLYDDFDTDIQGRENKLFDQENRFSDAKKHIHRKIRTLRDKIDNLESRLAFQASCNDTLRAAKDKAQMIKRTTELKACNFDNLKAALALVLDPVV